MMKQLLLILILIITCSCTSSTRSIKDKGSTSMFHCTPLNQSLTQNSYKFKSKKNGIKLFTKKGARYIEVAGEGILDAPVELVLKQLYDYPRQQKFMKRIKTTVEIKKEVNQAGDQITYVYHRLKLPVVSDRDYVFKSIRSQLKPAGYKVEFKAVPHNQYPPKSGIVRMKNHHGCWQITPDGSGKKTEIRFELLTNPGGSLPDFMVERYTPDEIFASFDSLKAMIKDAEKNEIKKIQNSK